MMFLGSIRNWMAILHVCFRCSSAIGTRLHAYFIVALKLTVFGPTAKLDFTLTPTVCGDRELLTAYADPGDYAQDS